jgi:hypothetical protein
MRCFVRNGAFSLSINLGTPERSYGRAVGRVRKCRYSLLSMLAQLKHRYPRMLTRCPIVLSNKQGTC